MNEEKTPLDEVASAIEHNDSLSEEAKAEVMRNLHKLKNTKVHILITGATGCGKSSTINALFNADKAKVGQGVDPETMDIRKYEFNNIVLYDSPGLGDGKDADYRHAKNITDKLYEKDSNGKALIDLVLVILDGSGRDLGTSFELINQVIIPNLGDDTQRLLVAINQADMAMKGRGWNHQENRPELQLEQFLKDKVASTQRRIKEATAVDVEPIYYCAGYKDGDQAQNPYNLSKLLLFILQHTPREKRAVIAEDLNRDKKVWADDDKLKDYREEVRSTVWDSIKYVAGEAVGVIVGVGKAVVDVVSGAFSLLKGLFGF